MAQLRFQGIVRQSLLIVGYLTQVLFNIVSTQGLLADTDNAELSDKYQTPITPAGYTFAVWGVIYFCQAVFILYQALPSQRDSTTLDDISTFVLVAFLLNAFWLVVFSYEYLWAAFVVILMYLLSLLKVYLILDPYYFEPHSNTKDTLCVWLAFSSNLAWVTVATLLNLTIAITATFQVSTPEMIDDWSVGLIFTAVFISGYYTVVRVDPMYAAVSLWALLGISNGPYNPPKTIAIGASVAVAIFFFIGSSNMMFQRVFLKVPSTDTVAKVTSTDANANASSKTDDTNLKYEIAG